jgi:hypothetical protein
MEYPFILVQEIVLIFLVLKYMDLINTTTIGGFGLYLAITSGFLFEILPDYFLSILAVSNTMKEIWCKLISFAF